MSASAAVNVHQSELDKFASIANQWWDAEGPQKALHVLNPVRLEYVRKHVSLAGKTVLDVGCGGGILSEALALAGASVTALDLAPELVNIARLHALESGARVNYKVQSVEALADESPGTFDAVTCMELLEHVPNPCAIVAACAQALKPGGRLFVSTINRTPAAFALAIVAAEHVVRLVPKGTHQYDQFIRPSELADWMRAAGLTLNDVSGVRYLPFVDRAYLTSRPHVNYLAFAVKP